MKLNHTFTTLFKGHVDKLKKVTVQIVFICILKTGPEIIKPFSCSTQLSVKLSLRIDMTMPTKAGIFIFISREISCSITCSKKEFAIVARKNLQ